MLQFTVFDIFAVKWPKFRYKISNFGGSVGHHPQKGEDLSGTDMHHHAKVTTICATFAKISNQTEKKLSKLPY